jgi:hypothetical protein
LAADYYARNPLARGYDAAQQFLATIRSAARATKGADLTRYILEQLSNEAGTKYQVERKLRTFCAICTLAVLLGFSSVGHAGDEAKDKVFRPILPPVDLNGGYSVNLDTDKPKPSDLDAPPALSPLRDDSIHPYVGLKLIKPLPSN